MWITVSTQPREVNRGATWMKKVAAPGLETEINGCGNPLRWPRDTPLFAKVGTNFADRRRPLCRYSSRTMATELLFILLDKWMFI